MKALSKIRTWLRHSLTPALALQTFTAVIGVKPNQHEALARLLAAQDRENDPSQSEKEESPYASVPGLHNLRWILFTPSEKTTSHAPGAQRALILNMAFDGELDDMLEELLLPARAGAAAVRDDLLAVLRHCEGFHGESRDPARYLRRREVPSGFVFRDIGPIDPDQRSASAVASAGARVQRTSSDTADATLAELREACDARTRFADFYAAHPPSAYRHDPARLAKEFLAEFDDDPARLPLHPLEVRQAEEARWVRLASELMQRKQRRVARHMGDGVVRRGAHAKGHGLVHATFEVCEPASKDDAKYHVGLFERPGEKFDAVLRPSNSADSVNPDRKGDLRGLGISLDVSEKRGVWLGEPGRQDFLLANPPVFFASNIQSFVRLLAVVELRDVRRKLWHGARFLLLPGALNQVRIAAQSSLRRLRHPLRTTFHSAVPYQLGRDHIVKYSVEPSSTARLEQAPRNASDDRLSRALEGSLDAGFTLDFFVHALPVCMDRGTLERAVEDATLDWSRLGARRVKLATIAIEAQSEGVDARRRQAEEREFSPWNALDQHRPLGNINRARRRIYAQGAALRREARHAASSAPSEASPSNSKVVSFPPPPPPAQETEAAQ